MKVSCRWLSELIDLKNIGLYELTEKLTLAGFEIEEIHNLQNTNDTIIDLKLTANRQDVSFLVGLAREISILFDKPLNNHFEDTLYHTNQKSHKNNQAIPVNSLYDLKINTITNITNRPSPQWLQNYLLSYNVETTYILNDIIKYIKIKWGQDIEIFDTKKIDILPISNKHLRIDNKGDISEIIHNKTQLCNTDIESIKYKDKVLSIIGIESNKNIYCDINTCSVIVCSTICKPAYIQSITKQLNLKTEKSIQHIKQILRCDFTHAYNETIQLITTFSKGTIGKCYEYHSSQDIVPTIVINKNIINNILGPTKNQDRSSLSVEKIFKILHQLKFKTTYNHIKNIFHIKIPRYRVNDIKRPIDIIEEIGRIYGFEKFSDTLPITKEKGYISEQTKITKKIRKILRDLGIHEAIHYSLKQKNNNILDNQYNISLFNPLTEDQSKLQDNLITNLIEIQQYNIKQKNFDIEAFEIGRIFTKNEEEIHLACLIGKSNFLRSSWSDKPKELNWFQAKGIIEEFFEKLRANVAWKQFNISCNSGTNKNLSHSHLFQQKRTCTIYNPITQEDIGLFGELNYKYNYHSHSNCKTYICEIHLSYLMNAIDNINHLNHKIKAYSLYPSVSRDISVKLGKNEHIDKVRQKILRQNNSLLESIEIFNEYKYINNTKNTNRNISLRVTYRAKNRTLNNTDLNRIDQEINYLLTTNLNK